MLIGLISYSGIYRFWTNHAQGSDPNPPRLPTFGRGQLLSCMFMLPGPDCDDTPWANGFANFFSHVTPHDISLGSSHICSHR